MVNEAVNTTELARLVEAFSVIPTSIVADCMDRLTGTWALRPYHRSGKLCGLARTVQVASGDNLFIHHALNQCGAGEVIVVDGGGNQKRALVGEMMMLFARSRGCAGFVIDGAIRDGHAFHDADFPCYAAGQTMRGPYKNGPGATQIPVTINGMVVSPGDIVLGDEDGVIAVPRSSADSIFAAALTTLASEEDTKARIAAGTSDRTWVLKRLAALRA